MRRATSWLKSRGSDVRALSILILTTLCLALPVFAQEVTATINGTITDQTGSALAGAQVTATDLDRGTEWPAKTNGTGFYNLTRLPVGRYEVRVTAPGFETAVQSPIELQLNQVALVNIKLVVGKTSESVNVTSDAPLLQTETTDVGTVIDAVTNVDLPLASRNYLQLSLTTPGAVTVQPSGFESGENAGQVARPEINGNRFDANTYLLDGMDNNDAGSNYVVYAPQPDAIQEFRVITQNAPADFGSYMGGIISASIKEGTNAFHGTAFEFFRNDILNANQWMNKLVPGSAVPRQKLRWNEFGGTVGGPIRTNKLFFFADYEGERFDFPSTSSLITVFTTKERSGDVSELVAAGKNIVDPNTGLPFQTTRFLRELSAAAQKIVNSSLYPTPINSSLQSNASTRVPLRLTRPGRWPSGLRRKREGPLYGPLLVQQTEQPRPELFRLAYNSANMVTSWNFVTGYTRTISSNLVNDARLGVNYVQRWAEPHLCKLLRQRKHNVRYSRVNYKLLACHGLQRGICQRFGTKDSVTDNYDTSIQYSDVLNWVHGKHNTRFGFQGWRIRTTGLFNGNNGQSGSFSVQIQSSRAVQRRTSCSACPPKSARATQARSGSRTTMSLPASCRTTGS